MAGKIFSKPVTTMPFHCHTLLVCILFACHVAANATPASICFRNIASKDGLSHNAAQAFAQDSENRMWIGTVNGLNCYDGNSIKSYFTAHDDSTSIGSNFIYSLFKDMDGTLWAGTMTGLSCYNASDDSFTNFFPENGIALHVFAIGETDPGHLIIGTNHGLFAFDKNSGVIGPEPLLPDREVYSVSVVDSSTVLLGTSSGALLYDCMEKSFSVIIEDIAFAVLYNQASGHTFIGSETGGVFEADRDFRICRRYFSGNRPEDFVSDKVRTLMLDRQGQLWVGTMEGIVLIDTKTGASIRYSHSEFDDSSLAHNSVRVFWEDEQGGIWVGTYYGGVDYYHPAAPQFKRFRHFPYTNTLSDNVVSCISEDSASQTLWIGTNDGGVNVYDRESGRFSYFRAGGGSNSLKSDGIRCIMIPSGGRTAYIGTYDNGLSCVDIPSGKITHYDLPDITSFKNITYTLSDAGDGTFWVGTMAGLYLFDRQSRTFRLHPLAGRYPNLQDILVQTIFHDSGRRVWIATQGGLYLYADGRLEAVEAEGPAQGMIYANCIMEDSSGRIWVGSSTGLYCFSGDSSTPVGKWSARDGLADNDIMSILEDGRGRLWVSTNGGISRFDTDNGIFCNYSDIGVSPDQFMPNSSCRTADGRMFFGTHEGLVSFSPDDINDTPFTPGAVIRDISVHNPARRKMTCEKDSYGHLLKAVFPSSAESVQIKFSVTNYLSGRHNGFSYILEGADKDWTFSPQVPEGCNTAVYPRLSPGRYTFMVKARNDSGLWSPDIAGCEIRVLPVWYQTWWMKTIFVLTAAGLLCFIVYSGFTQVKMRMQLKIEHIEQMKIRELSQEKIRFYINSSHELRTPVTLMLSPIEELMTGHYALSDNVKKKLSYAYKNGKLLLRRINQLLDFRKAESGNMPVHITAVDIDSLSRNVLELFLGKAQKHSITAHFLSETGGKRFLSDSFYLESILTNLLSNAFKFTPDGGDVWLTVWEKDKDFGLTVKDSGIGISREMLPHIFERFYSGSWSEKGSGIGLSLVKLMTESLHGHISVNSEEGKFTEFVCSFPAVAFGTDETDATDSASLESGIEILPEYGPDMENPETPDVEPPAGPDDRPEGEKAVILVVDDNVEILQYLKDCFSATYEVLTADNGKDALETVLNRKVDIVVSDVMMPRTDGIKLCEAIKRNIRTCHIPVILLSAKGDIETQAKGIYTGADDYIAKPFSIGILKGKIRNILKTRERLRRHYADSRDIDPAAVTSNELDREFMSKAIRIVEANLSNENFSASQLADGLCISRSSLYLKMKSVFGESPAGFIRKVRFNTACRLLLEGRYTIAEIGNMVGFGSSSYFTTGFKKFVGCLPSEYVRKHSQSK